MFQPTGDPTTDTLLGLALLAAVPVGMLLTPLHARWYSWRFDRRMRRHPRWEEALRLAGGSEAAAQLMISANEVDAVAARGRGARSL